MKQVTVKCGGCGSLLRVSMDPMELKKRVKAPGTIQIEVKCKNCGGRNRFPLYWDGVDVFAANQSASNSAPAASTPTPKTPPAPKRPPQAPVTPSPAPKPKPTPKPTPKSAPTPPPQERRPTVRTIEIWRPGHAHKTVDATLKDMQPIHPYLDGVDQGVLKTGQTMTLGLDEGPHVLRNSILGPKCDLPAGTDSYTAVFHENQFKVGIKNDPFKDQLALFMLNMFRGQGIRDRILDLNNRKNDISLHFDPKKGIRLAWSPLETKGFQQWSTGEVWEFISFAEAGLTPPPPARLPTGYWGKLADDICEAIDLDKGSDVTLCGFHRFTIPSHHKLY